MDAQEAQQALRRLEDLWHPWYEITYGNGIWCAVRRDRDAEPLNAVTPEALNAKVIMDYMGDMRLARLGQVDVAQETVLAEVRRKHCTLWDYIGPDADSTGWRASRTISPGITHHVVALTIAELGAELDALEAPDNDEASVN